MATAIPPLVAMLGGENASKAADALAVLAEDDYNKVCCTTPEPTPEPACSCGGSLLGVAVGGSPIPPSSRQWAHRHRWPGSCYESECAPIAPAPIPGTPIPPSIWSVLPVQPPLPPGNLSLCHHPIAPTPQDPSALSLYAANPPSLLYSTQMLMANEGAIVPLIRLVSMSLKGGMVDPPLPYSPSVPCPCIPLCMELEHVPSVARIEWGQWRWWDPSGGQGADWSQAPEGEMCCHLAGVLTSLLGHR